MASNYYISGIQQIGIGITSAPNAFKWYRENLGMDVPIFDEKAEASLMLPYTGGLPRFRHAILALNLMGGGGAEIWQYTSREGQAANFELQPGDLGIYIARYKSKDIDASYKFLSQNNSCSNIQQRKNNQRYFYCKDPYGNIIELVEDENWFQNNISHSGGIYGAVIGVSNMEKSLAFYKDILGYDHIISDDKLPFESTNFIEKGNQLCRVVNITHSKPRVGPFSQLLGKSELQLVQSLERKPKVIFENRLWGDLGYIHLCFDIGGMNDLRKKCQLNGSPFTVDSGDFDMGEAAGQFAYIEDPDGTLIEFVETHKIPIIKKIGWYLNLKKRNSKKPLPKLMIKALGLGRVK